MGAGRCRAMLAVAAGLSLAPGVRGQASFQGLAFLPTGTSSTAYAISGDGTTVVGESVTAAGTRAFRWTAALGMQDLGTLPAKAGSSARAVSANGLAVAGNSGGRGFRWTSAAGLKVDLGVLPGGTSTTVSGISANGQAVVGTCATPQGQRAFRWTVFGTMQDLGVLTGGTDSFAAASSADGGSACGISLVGGVPAAFRWAPAGLRAITPLPGNSQPVIQAYAMSSNGGFVVGTGNSALGNHAFRWNAATGLTEDLGSLPTATEAVARGVSADGAVVVGTSDSVDGFHAIVWTASAGMIRLKAALEEQGLNLSAWTLLTATGVSSDGLTITGTAAGPNGQEAYLARLNARPCYANCDWSAGAGGTPSLGAADFTCFLNRFVAGDARANCDGSTAQPTLTILDFICFQQKLAAGCR